MFSRKNHIGRPSNDEIRWRRLKKIILIMLPIVLIAVIGILISSGSFSNLMGNSTFEYYCENADYKLVGDKCEKTIEANFALLGDVNNDSLVDSKDLNSLNDYLDKEDTDLEYSLSEVQFLSADINTDSEVSYADYMILNDYLNKAASTYSKYYEKIGVEKKCPSNYELNSNKCIYKETINAEQREKTKNINYTITFDANGGEGNMQTLSITNSDSVTLPKNKFTYKNKKFAGWNVYSESANKWLCYLKDNDKENIANRKFMRENECSYGKSLISDTETISALATSNKEEIVFYATWIDGVNSNVDVSFIPDVTKNTLKKNEKVNLIVDFKVEGNHQYYYKWFTYSYGVQHHESPCQTVFNGKTAPKSLTMFGDRQGGIQLYEDDKCNIKYKNEYKTNNYICTNCVGVKAVFDDVKTTSYKKGTKVKNYVHFDIADTSKKYHYLWKSYQNGKLIRTSNCQLVEANKKFLKELTIDGSRKGKIEVYSDSKCKGKVITSVDTKRFTCSNCPPLQISVKNDTNNNLTEGKIAYTNVNFKILDSEDNNKYYYKWRTYRYNSLWVEDSCDLVKNGDIKFKLTMNGTRKGTITVYSDSKCSKRISSVPVAETKSYKCTNCPPVKIHIGNNLSSNQTNGTVIHNSISFTVYDKSNKYYHRWRTYNYGNLNATGKCIQIVSGKEYVNDLHINYTLQSRKGTVTVYSDSSCNKRVNSVPIASTKTYNCTNCNIPTNNNSSSSSSNNSNYNYSNNNSNNSNYNYSNNNNSSSNSNTCQGQDKNGNYKSFKKGEYYYTDAQETWTCTGGWRVWLDGDTCIKDCALKTSYINYGKPCPSEDKYNCPKGDEEGTGNDFFDVCEARSFGFNQAFKANANKKRYNYTCSGNGVLEGKKCRHKC